MKNAPIKILALVLLIFVAACSKDDLEVSTESLTGTWMITAQFSDIGNGTGDWKAVPDKDPKIYVEFKADGGLSGNAFPKYVSYSLQDSTTLVFMDANKVIQNYRIKFEGRQLIMSPSGPIMCIEGCATRFEKIK